MSLILDALRKLERDRSRPDPDVVVVGHVPWNGASRSRRWPAVLAAGLGGLALLAAGTVWLVRRAPATPPSATVASTTEPAAVPMTTVTAPAAPPLEAPTPASEPPAGAHARLVPATPASATAAATPAAVDRAPVARRLALPVPEEARASPESADATAAQESLPAAGARAPRLVLMAISERDGEPVAIISDRLVHVGDSFDGVKVLRIGATEVEVDDRGQRRLLRF